MAGSDKKKNDKKKEEGGNKDPTGSPADQGTPRKGIGSESYYRNELKEISRVFDKCVEDVEKSAAAQSGDADAYADAGNKCITDRDKSIAGAKRRRGRPSKRTVAEKKEELVKGTVALDRAKLKRQTPQGFLVQNLKSFGESSLAPCPQELEHLTLVSKYKGNLVNKLTTSAKLQPLMNILPYELSQLSPYFRVCKKDENGKLTEFQFAGHLKWKYVNESGTEVDLLTSMGQGVGLKSFKWDTTGTNLFSAPRTLKASLSLHFQSISELVRSARIDERGGPLWHDLIIPAKGRGAIPRECPTDLPEINEFLRKKLTADDIAKMTKEPGKPPEPDFSLVVEVGWKYGTNFQAAEGSGARAQAIKDAVDASRVVLNLTLVSHRFQFRDDGTIDLNVSYVARLEGIINDYGANLFNIDEKGINTGLIEQLNEKKKQMQNLQSSIDSPVGVFNCLEGQSLSKRQQNKLDKKAAKIEKEVDRIEEQLQLLTKKLKVSMYGRFSQYLLESGKLFFLDVPKALYAQGTLPSGPPPKSVKGSTYVGRLSNASTATTQQLLGARAKGESKKIIDRDVSAIKLRNRVYGFTKSRQPRKRGYKRVAFCYLGDLINFYAGVLPPKDNEVDKFEIILGDMTFLDYEKIGKEVVGAGSSVSGLANAFAAGGGTMEGLTKVQQAGRDKIFSSAGAYRVSHNMARIPISFDAYSTWFTSEIVNGDSVFTFKTFVQSLTTKLLVGALQSTEKESINEDMRRLLKERSQVKTAVVYGQNSHLKRRQINHEETTRAGESSFLVKPAPLDVSDGSIVGDNLSDEGKKMNENRQFFVFSVQRLPFSSQIVDEEQNALQGVYHLKIGVDKGLVKTIVLEKEANQRIRDANIMRAYNAGGAGLGIIQEPYNATVKLFGSGFFQPGQYVYINPTNIGLGTGIERRSIARKLGIGGFYLITQVSTSISEGSLETTLKCIFQNYGFFPDTGEDNASDPVDPAPKKTDLCGNAQAGQSRRVRTDQGYVDSIAAELFQ